MEAVLRCASSSEKFGGVELHLQQVRSTSDRNFVHGPGGDSVAVISGGGRHQLTPAQWKGQILFTPPTGRDPMTLPVTVAPAPLPLHLPCVNITGQSQRTFGATKP